MRVRVRHTLQMTPNRARGVRKWWEPWRPAGMHALDEDEDEVAGVVSCAASDARRVVCARQARNL